MVDSLIEKPVSLQVGVKVALFFCFFFVFLAKDASNVWVRTLLLERFLRIKNIQCTFDDKTNFEIINKFEEDCSLKKHVK